MKPNLFREVINLSGFWDFRVDPERKGEREKWYETPSSGWDKLYVPANWNEQCTDYMSYMGTAWYAKNFFIPEDWKKKIAFTAFEGVNYRARVWINGQPVGGHEGGFTPFRFRVESVLNCGSENRIAVEVDNTLSDKTIPPGEGMNATYFDFFHYGGIHRDAFLTAVPRLNVEDITIRTGISGEDGVVSTDVVVSNEEDRQLTCSLNLQVMDRSEGISEETEKLEILPRTKKLVTSELIVKDAKFWDVESPHLYLLRATLDEGEEVRDMLDTRFGIRTFEVEGGRILLNGHPVFLKGFGRHEDFPILGKALNGAILRKDYDLMRKTGANSFRTSHYPYSRTHLDLADELGHLVILELPTVGITLRTDSRRGLKRLDDPEMIEKAKKMLREMVGRDKNRPSVIMYSLFNEPSSDKQEFRKFLGELKNEANKLDPTRPITFASDHALSDRAFDMVDVICLNFYFGWYTEFGDLEAAEEMLNQTLKQVHLKHPEKPIIITEFGAGAIAGVHSDPPEMWTEEYQADLIKTYWKIMREKEYVVGGHIWCFSDFKTPQSSGRTTLNRKGIFTRTREPKLSAEVVKELFMATPTYPIR